MALPKLLSEKSIVRLSAPVFRSTVMALPLTSANGTATEVGLSTTVFGTVETTKLALSLMIQRLLA